MNITLNIVAENPEELQKAIIGLAGITGSTATPQPESAKRSSRGTTKPEKQPDPEPEKQPDPEPKPETTDADLNHDDNEPETIPTVVDLRAKAQEKGTTPEGKKAIKTLLDKFGSKSISDVAEEKRVDFMHALEALK